MLNNQLEIVILTEFLVAPFNPVPLHFLVEVLLAGCWVPWQTFAIAATALSSLELSALSFALGLCALLLVFTTAFFAQLSQRNVLLFILDLDFGITVLLEAFTSAPFAIYYNFTLPLGLF